MVRIVEKLGTLSHYSPISCLSSMQRRVVVENGESSAQHGNNRYRSGYFTRPLLCRNYLADLGLVIDLGISTALALPSMRQNLSSVNEDCSPAKYISVINATDLRARCHSDHSTAFYTLTALRGLHFLELLLTNSREVSLIKLNTVFYGSSFFAIKRLHTIKANLL